MTLQVIGMEQSDALKVGDEKFDYWIGVTDDSFGEVFKPVSKEE